MKYKYKLDHMKRDTNLHSLIREGTRFHELLKRDINIFNTSFKRFNNEYLDNFSFKIETLSKHSKRKDLKSKKHVEISEFYFRTKDYVNINFFQGIEQDIISNISDIAYLGLYIFENDSRKYDYRQ